MQVILETTSVESIDSAKPVDLWFLVTQQNVLPENVEDQDWGTELFSTDYDASRHAHLPVVNPYAPNLYQPSKLPILPVENQTRVPSKGANTIRRVVTLTRNIEQYEVIQAIVEVPNAEAIETLDTDDLWWGCLHAGVQAEADEHLGSEVSIEHEPYKAVKHKHLPLVVLQETMASEDGSPPMDFLSAWEPSGVAK